MIVIKKSKDGQFFFEVKARNGQVLVTSETYKRKASCAHGVSVTRNAIGWNTKVIDETKK